MDHGNVWRLPAMLFFLGTLVMLLAGAWRELETPTRPAPIVGSEMFWGNDRLQFVEVELRRQL